MKKNIKISIIIGIFVFLLFLGISIYNISAHHNASEDNRLMSLNLNNDEITLCVGDIINLDEIVNDKGNYTYEIADNDIVKLDKNNQLTGLKKGKTSIKIRTLDGVEEECTIIVVPKVDTVLVTNKDLEISVGDKKVLLSAVYPSDTTFDNLTWTSSNERVAKVQDGILIGVKEGKSTIILKDKRGISSSFVVNVFSETEEEYDNELRINKGDDVLLGAVAYKNKSVKLKSSNEDVISIKNGKLHGNKKGKSTITIEDEDGNEETCKVIVEEVKVSRIILSNEFVSTIIGKDLELSAEIIPNNAYNKKLTWSSSDEDIAAVQDGKIIGKRPGVVTIKAKSKNGIEEKVKVELVSNTKDKKAIFFGDSITYGYNNTPNPYSWANYLDKYADFKEIVNTGIGGWFISNNDDKFIASLIEEHKDETYDYVILSGGTNDVFRKFDIGTYDKDDFSGNYDEKTFLGGLETYIYKTKKVWPDAKVGFIITYETPLSSFNRRELSPSYYAKLKEVLDKWNVPYLDLYDGKNPLGEKYSDLLEAKTKKYLFDGLHLNKSGYKIISPYIYIWMNTL